MRTAFFRSLIDLAERDDRIEIVIGDLGFGAVEEFRDKFSSRFHNAGVAEQNMTGIATGLALTGSVVFTYSIANFSTLRCLEQIRNDACYHNASVNVVAVGGGLAYGALGVSHHATEDLAVLRAMPNIVVASPGDPYEVEAITTELVGLPGASYMRLGKAGEPRVHSSRPTLPPGRSLELSAGGDAKIFVTGTLLPTALAAAAILGRRGINAGVTSVPWIWPFDQEAVIRAARSAALVVTLEEHSVVGGLGGAVCEVLAEQTGVAPVVRIGLPRAFTSIVGSQEYLRSTYRLDPASVAIRIEQGLKERDELARSLR